MYTKALELVPPSSGAGHGFQAFSTGGRSGSTRTPSYPNTQPTSVPSTYALGSSLLDELERLIHVEILHD